MTPGGARLPEREQLRRTSRRLGLQTGALVLGCVLVVAGVAAGLAARAFAEETASRLESAVESTGRVDDVGAGLWVAVAAPGGVQTTPGMPEGLPDVATMEQVARTGEEVRDRVTLPSGEYDVLTDVERGRVVQAVADTAESREELARMLTALAVAGGVGVLLATAAGWWFARRAVRPLATALAMQRRFVMDASHELRTPLTLLSTRAQLLRRRLDDPDGGRTARVGEDVDGLLADTAALTEILDDLLVAADARAVERVPVDVAAVVREVVDAVRPTAEGRGLRLVREGVEEAVVVATPVAVRRAVTALVDNAVDYAGSEVRVLVLVSRDDVRVVVEDDGPGVPQDVTGLFDRFASGRRDGEGRAGAEGADRRHYGLGLALVAEIAAQHGGSVAAGVRQDGARGARLTVLLPRARPRPR
ncbi:sensor histidine kinase [Isoptericola sp. NPDC055881]